MNLITNGGFEVNTTGWSKAGGAGTSIARDTSEKHDGVASCKCVTGGAASAEGFQLTSGLPTIRAGEPYALRGWVKADDGDTLNIIWREIGGNVIKTLAFTGNGAWQYFEALGESDGSGDGTARVQFLTPTTQAFTFYADGLVFGPLSHPMRAALL